MHKTSHSFHLGSAESPLLAARSITGLTSQHEAEEVLGILKEERDCMPEGMQDLSTCTVRMLEGVYGLDVEGIDSKEVLHKFE